MAVAGDDLTAVESGPYVFFDSSGGSVFADLGLHLTQPDEKFLVGKTSRQLALDEMWMDGSARKGPARPFKTAPQDKKGSESAEPTSFPMCAETLPPS